MPVELREAIGVREVVRTCGTESRREAEAVAWEFATSTKRLFLEAGGTMTIDPEKLRQILRLKKAQLKISDLEEEVEERDRRHAQELRIQREEAARLADHARLEGENRALRALLSASTGSAHLIGSPTEPGEPIAPAAQRRRLKKDSRTLSDALPIWQRLSKPAAGSIEIYSAEVRRFEAKHPGLAVNNITRAHIRDYVQHLEEVEGLSPRSIEKAHGVLRALLNIAKDQEWLSGDNPASSTRLPKIPSKPIRGFKHDELVRIFAAPVFTAGHRPVAGKGDAAFWMPLLFLWTGARREEIGQLTVDRVVERDGVACMLIDTIEDDDDLKTPGSRRAVPIHDALVGLGFLEYVEKRRLEGGKQLFPLLTPNKRGQLAAKWGDWWSRYLKKEIGIKDSSISPAHSFRHSFITACRGLNMRPDFERALVGHVGDGKAPDAHDGYGIVPLDALAQELNKIDFRGLDLSNVRP